MIGAVKVEGGDHGQAQIVAQDVLVEVIVPGAVEPGAQAMLGDQLRDGDLAVIGALGVVDQVDQVLRDSNAGLAVPVAAGSLIVAVGAEDAQAGAVVVAAQLPAACGLKVEVVDVVGRFLGHDALQGGHIGLVQQSLVVVHEEGVVGEGNGVDGVADLGGGSHALAHLLVDQGLGGAAQAGDGARVQQLLQLVVGEEIDVSGSAHILKDVLGSLVLTDDFSGPGDIPLGMLGGKGLLLLFHNAGIHLVLGAPDLQRDVRDFAGGLSITGSRLLGITVAGRRLVGRIASAASQHGKQHDSCQQDNE